MDRNETILLCVLGICLTAAFGLGMDACKQYNSRILDRAKMAIERGCTVVNDSTVVCTKGN